MSSSGEASLVIPSPIGGLLAIASPTGLTSLSFEGRWTGEIPRSESEEARAILRTVSDEIAAYFAGTLRRFTVPCVLTGSTFQAQVWSALREIPYGDVVSYRTIAERIGNPKSVRAVGAANGRNPIPIIVPCHRVVGSDGSRTGFGGGVPRKRWLLEHEGAAARSLL